MKSKINYYPTGKSPPEADATIFQWQVSVTLTVHIRQLNFLLKGDYDTKLFVAQALGLSSKYTGHRPF